MMEVLMLTKEIMTPEQVADYLQLNPTTIYRYIREGKLIASKIGRQYRVPKNSVDLLLITNIVPKGLKLRSYSREQINEFIKEDRLDEETTKKAEAFIKKLSIEKDED